MRFAKRKANRVVRRDEDVANGNFYRKVVERWSFPDDGKKWHDHPKAYRK